MWSGCQQGNGYSKESESLQEWNSHHKALNLADRSLVTYLRRSFQSHEAKLNALINQYEKNGDSRNVVRVKAENVLLPDYRKELRKVVLEYLE